MSSTRSLTQETPEVRLRIVPLGFPRTGNPRHNSDGVDLGQKWYKKFTNGCRRGLSKWCPEGTPVVGLCHYEL